jgi:tetratricopeptide (TPR) repeat protein
MSQFSTKSLSMAGAFAALLGLSAPPLRAQAAEKHHSAAVHGKVHDAQDQALAAVVISLEGTDSASLQVTTSDEQGQFRFADVPAGNYTLHAKLAGYEDCTKGPFVLPDAPSKSMDLLLTKAQPEAALKDPAAALGFSDEPAFTVAGVTDTTALGGHGSGPIVRNSNALSRETVSLARGGSGPPDTSRVNAVRRGPEEEAVIRAKLASEDSADLHEQLAEVEEAESHPLEAVREYQRAAEMQPTEPHLFAWGAELLLHHAPEPAIEVFSKGHRLYPQSGRMILGLGAAWYAERSKDQAEQIFLEASDLHPSDPSPYLFLGRVQALEPLVPAAWAERMKRFVSFHPEMAMAHYLYAVALLKQSGHPEQSNVVEAELNTALKLDRQLGDAYLQLGILRSGRQDYPGALAALEKAIENTPIAEEAHYRLAQVYRHMGETEKASQEIAQFKKISEQKEADAERERHEIPQFVYTLRGQNSAPPPTPDSH